MSNCNLTPRRDFQTRYRIFSTSYNVNLENAPQKPQRAPKRLEIQAPEYCQIVDIFFGFSRCRYQTQRSLKRSLWYSYPALPLLNQKAPNFESKKLILCHIEKRRCPLGKASPVCSLFHLLSAYAKHFPLSGRHIPIPLASNEPGSPPSGAHDPRTLISMAWASLLF